MESVNICRNTVATISQSQTLNSCNNVTRTVSRRPSRSSLNLLPRGLADYSSRSSLYVNRSEGLKLVCRDGGAYKVKSNGQRGRIVSAKGSDNGSPRPDYRFFLHPCSVFFMYEHLSFTRYIVRDLDSLVGVVERDEEIVSQVFLVQVHRREFVSL